MLDVGCRVGLGYPASNSQVDLHRTLALKAKNKKSGFLKVNSENAAAGQRYLVIRGSLWQASTFAALAVLLLTFATLRCSAAAGVPQTIRFGGDAIYPPFEYLHRGEAKGFNIDLARSIGTSGGKRVTHQLGDWPEVVAELERGGVDVLPMFVSESRAQRFAFTTPFFVVSHAIYAKHGTEPVHLIAELAGRRVAVEDRSYAEQQFRNLELGIKAIPTLNTAQALEAVATGSAEYAVLAIPSASTIIRDQKLAIRQLGPPFWPREYAFAVRRDRPEILAWVQSAYDTAVAEGDYDSIYEHWRKRLPTVGPSIQVPMLWGVAIASAVFLGGFIGFARLHHLRQNASAETNQALREIGAAKAEATYFFEMDAETRLPRAPRFLREVDEAIAPFNTAHPVESTREMLMCIAELTQLSAVTHSLGRDHLEAVIRDFASALKARCDGPVGYLGRGVFALFTSQGNAQRLYEQILAAEKREAGLYSHFNAGVSRFPRHGRSAVDLLKHAETALTFCRSTGRRRAEYDPAMEPDEVDIGIVESLRKRKLQGLYWVLQPKLDLSTSKIAGAEALVRWNHPQFGSIAPTRFVPLAESAGLISLITRTMVDEAVRCSAMLRQQHLPSSISVNISIRDLVESDLPELVRQALQKHEGNSGDLHLEITETSVAKDFRHTIGILNELRAMGVQLSVDDFGTGFASLAYLSFFPIDEVKIDRTFVSDMLANPKNQSIVRSTILMANELGLRTVAEGAEDLETQAALAQLGCDQLQGYVLSKPLAEADYVQFLIQHAKKYRDER
ncbi:EAL domain-containing protein [Proteobacteria bacterium 005FR1]|nr:EAL domain-containing protein [Proteobacteria bacterium 005FR1]